MLGKAFTFFHGYYTGFCGILKEENGNRLIDECPCLEDVLLL
jgi:hypothetical protein